MGMNDAVSRSPFLTFDRTRWVFAILAVVGAINGLVGAWLVTAGPTDPVEHAANFLRFLVSPWMLGAYVVTVAVGVLGAWRLRRMPPPVAAGDTDRTLRRRAVQFAVVVALVGSALSGIGYLYVRDVENANYADRAAEQQLVARIKAQQVGKWLFETTVNTEMLAASIARMPLDRLPGDRDVAQVTGLLFAEALAGNPERTALTLFSARGDVLVHEGEGGGPDDATREAVRALIASPAASRIVELHNEAGEPPRPRMGLVVPVGTAPGAPSAGWLAVSLDPFRGVLQKFTAWPTPSATSEVLLVHRVGDDAVFIAPPARLLPPPPPNSFGLPLTNKRLTAAQALTEGPGIHPGIDYRGTPVLSAYEKVNGLPWFVGAKTDEQAFVEPVRNTARRLALVIGAGILLVVLSLWVLYRGERSALRAQARQAELQHRALDRHFENLTRLARDIVYLIDPEGRIVDCNDAGLEAYGYTRDELLGMPVVDLRPPEERAVFDRQWQLSEVQPDGVLFETVHRRKDGSTFPVEISGRIVEVEGRPYRQAFVRDITGRRALERQVARLSRVRSALQAATSVLLRSRDENEMYERLCGVLVREAGYRMANVAMPNDDATRSVRFVAIAGVDNGYLERARITWADEPQGRGPTGTAIRSGEIQVNQDFTSNPQAAPWRDAALKNGFRSSISLPLRDGDRVFAVLTLYAAEPDAFDDDEVKLLVALSTDLAYAALASRNRRAA